MSSIIAVRFDRISRIVSTIGGVNNNETGWVNNNVTPPTSASYALLTPLPCSSQPTLFAFFISTQTAAAALIIWNNMDKALFVYFALCLLFVNVLQVDSVALNVTQFAVLSPTVPIAAVLSPAVPIAPAPRPKFIIDDACLRCICVASTQCQPRACFVAGPSQYYCGSYLISWAYWADAGKPQDNPLDPHGFEKCLTHSPCAEQTVRQYMAKYGQDCNADGQVNCLDYARIHKSGAHGCSAAWVDSTDYWKAFTTCLSAPVKIN